MIMTNVVVRLILVFFLSQLSFGCATVTIPERLRFLGYQGHVNEHEILVQSSTSRVYSLLTDFDTFATLIPSQRIRVTKITPGPMDVGTVTCTQTGYKIKLRWHSKVVEKKPNRMMVLQFQDGIFKGGYEVWELRPEGLSTRVTHTILYNISNPIYGLVWTFKHGERKHNELVEATLQHLKQLCEGTPVIRSAVLR